MRQTFLHLADLFAHTLTKLQDARMDVAGVIHWEPLPAMFRHSFHWMWWIIVASEANNNSSVWVNRSLFGLWERLYEARQVVSYESRKATAWWCQTWRRWDDLGCPDAPFFLFSSLDPAVTVINHHRCHFVIHILTFESSGTLRMVSPLDPMFPPLNELLCEALSPLILPLISPANACVSESRSYQNLLNLDSCVGNTELRAS